jgi:hypothetical protein
MKTARKSTIFLCSMAGLSLLFISMLIHASARRAAEMTSIVKMACAVRENGLTDLCLFTEASYTRNPTQTDLHTPFQENPASLEHFPSGSLLPPPEHLKENHAANF